MQRTELSVSSCRAASADKHTLALEMGQFHTAEAPGPCAVFAPMHYEPGYAYPLIVWLHGEGGDERQLLRVMPQISLRNYVAIAPRGGNDSDGESDRAGCRWRPIEERLDTAASRVDDCIALAMRRFHIAPRRVFLAGFDSGGSMAFRLAFSQPYRFAGVLSLCGRFPSNTGGLAQWNGIRGLPVFLTVGRHSEEYPSNLVCRDLRLLHSAGVSITLREYPCGQELTPQMLADLDRWIIEQITAKAVI